jgi:catechol 2,3-dioxygenase-like lactoylglutathione lyase family enzyme
VRKRWALTGLLVAAGFGVFAHEPLGVARTDVALQPRAPQTLAATTASSSTALVTAVDAVEVVVRDLGRSRQFFETLGFVAVDDEELAGAAEEGRTGVAGARVRRVGLVLGAERLALLQFLAPADGGRAVPRDTHGNDLWFQHVAIVVSDMGRAYTWLRAHHVAHVSSGPQTLPAWNRAAGGIQAFYFADPDGHTLEVIHFPHGKGDPRWQKGASCQRRPAELCLFLGIDHTAITVEDTDASLAFYRGRLGLRVVGASENYGPEQEHLNGVFGARLRITALRAAQGPGIELLEYLSPRGGRPMPPDVRANDAFHWQVVAQAEDASAVAAAAIAVGGRRVSQSVATGEALLRDRDGHALLVRSRAPRRAD